MDQSMYGGGMGMMGGGAGYTGYSGYGTPTYVSPANMAIPASVGGENGAGYGRTFQRSGRAYHPYKSQVQ